MHMHAPVGRCIRSRAAASGRWRGPSPGCSGTAHARAHIRLYKRERMQTPKPGHAHSCVIIRALVREGACTRAASLDIRRAPCARNARAFPPKFRRSGCRKLPSYIGYSRTQTNHRSQAGGPKTSQNKPRCDAMRPARAVLLQLLGRTLRRFFQPEFQKYRDLACRLLEDDYELALEIIEHVRQPADTPAPAPAPATAMRV